MKKTILGLKSDHHHIFWRSLLSLLLILLSSLPQSTRAQGQEGVTITATAGFDSIYKIGEWMPVRVRMENNGQDLEGTIEVHLKDTSGNDLTYMTPVYLPSQSRKEVFLYLAIDSYLSEIPLSLVSGNKTITRVSIPVTNITANDRLFGVVASTPSAYYIINELDPPSGNATTSSIGLPDLPEREQALRSLDILVISNVDTGTLSQAQKDALAGWLAGGGQLIITGGIGWQKTAAGLADILPLTPTATQNLVHLKSLEVFSGSKIPLDLGVNNIPIATGTLNAGAEVIVEQEGLPLVIRRQYGMGNVYYLAADPALPPLKNWDGISDFYRQLLTYQVDLPYWVSGFHNCVQASQAAGNLPGLGLLSILIVCSFLGIYVAVLGPLNYLVLRVIKRRELAWITIPVLVILFSVLSILVGGLSHGRQPIITQSAIVQVWPDVEQTRVDGIINIYSPRRATYQAEFSSQYLPQLPFGAWIDSGQDITVVQNEDSTTVPDLRIDVSGIRTLIAIGSIQSPKFSNHLNLVINHRGVFLQGSFTNNSVIKLIDSVLLYPGGVITIGDFEPGETYEVDIPLQQAELSGKSNQVNSSLTYTGIVTPYTYYGYPQDTTMEEIIGTSNYYDDNEIFQRYSLLSTVQDVYASQYGRGGGIYLSGWSDDAPIGITLTDQQFRTDNTTLYLVTMDPTILLEGEIIKLTPGAFVWRLLSDSTSIRNTPYAGTMNIGEVQSLQFALGLPIKFSAVKSLTLHLKDPYNTHGPANLKLSLWDFSEQRWSELPNLDWGDYSVPDPVRCVDPDGTIRLRIENSNVQYQEILTSDFTLEVIP